MSKRAATRGAETAAASANSDIVERVLKRSERAKTIRNLRARLQFALYKLNHGWGRLDVGQVGELYAEQLARKRKSGTRGADATGRRRSASSFLPQNLGAYSGDIFRDPSPDMVAAELILSFKQSPSPYRNSATVSPPNSFGSMSSVSYDGKAWRRPQQQRPGSQKVFQGRPGGPQESGLPRDDVPVANQGGPQNATSSCSGDSAGPRASRPPASEDDQDSLFYRQQRHGDEAQPSAAPPQVYRYPPGSSSSSARARPSYASYQYPYGNEANGLALIAGAASEI